MKPTDDDQYAFQNELRERMCHSLMDILDSPSMPEQPEGRHSIDFFLDDVDAMISFGVTIVAEKSRTEEERIAAENDFYGRKK